jgi:hypothetical protein
LVAGLSLAGTIAQVAQATRLRTDPNNALRRKKQMSSRILGACILSFAMVLSIGVAEADDQNTGVVLAVGKINASLCRIKVQGATFPSSCPTAIYQEAYFTCNSSEGKDLLAIALAARLSGAPVRIVTNSCSPNGSSVANLVGIHVEQ